MEVLHAWEPNEGSFMKKKNLPMILSELASKSGLQIFLLKVPNLIKSVKSLHTLTLENPDFQRPKV